MDVELKKIIVKVEGKQATFRQANPDEYSAYSTLSAKEQILEAAQFIYDATYLEGDREVFEDLDNLVSVLRYVPEVLNPFETSSTVEDGKIIFEVDGKKATFRKPVLSEVSRYLAASRRNGFDATKELVRKCMVEGDTELLGDVYAIATCEVIDELVTVKISDVKKS